MKQTRRRPVHLGALATLAVTATAGCGALLGIDSWQDVDCVVDCGASDVDATSDAPGVPPDSPPAEGAGDAPLPDAGSDALDAALEDRVITRAQALQYQDINATLPDGATGVDLPMGPQAAGNTNVVVIGWFDVAAIPANFVAVSDSNGNAYSLIRSDVLVAAAQQMWVATGIKAGATIVHAAFAQPVTGPDIRVLEYSGIQQVDKNAGTTGNDVNGAITSVGATLNGRLVVLGGSARGSYGAADASFSMLLIDPGGDFGGEQFVDAGPYVATARLNSGGYWVMQLVSFR